MSVNINVNSILKKVKKVLIRIGGGKRKVNSIWVNKNGTPTKVYDNYVPMTDRFVAGNSFGTLYSTDAITWIYRNNEDLRDSKELIYGKGKFISISAYGFFYSINGGLNWNLIDIFEYGFRPVSMAFGNDNFVYVNESGEVYYSADGLSWTLRLKIPNATNYGYYGYNISYCYDRFFCTGGDGNNNYSSLDGIVWYTLSGFPTSQDSKMVYGKGKYICVCTSGRKIGTFFYSSTDAITWTLTFSIIEGNYADALIYAGNKFVYGFVDFIYYSTDGITWTKTTVDKSDGSYFSSITYGNGRFICCDKENLYSSTDAITWKKLTLPSMGMSRPLSVTFGSLK